MTLRVDEQGRPLALVAYSPSQPRVESGPTAGQWVSDGNEDAAAGDDAEAKALYSQMLGPPPMSPDQQKKFLAGLNPDQLKRVSAFAALGKATKGPIADIRNAAGEAMKSRGMDPGSVGLKSKDAGKKKAAAKKGGKSGGGSKGGGGKSSGGGKKSSGGSKSGGSKSSGSSSKKSSGSKSSTKAPPKTTTPKPAKPTPPTPPPPAVNPIGPGRPGLPGRPAPAPGTQPVSRPAGRVGKRRRRAAPGR